MPGRSAPNLEGSETALPSKDAPSPPGTLGAGTRTHSCTATYGTIGSMPQTALWVAKQMIAKGPSDQTAAFNAAATKELASPATLPAKRGGGGRFRSQPIRPLRQPLSSPWVCLVRAKRLYQAAGNLP